MKIQYSVTLVGVLSLLWIDGVKAACRMSFPRNASAYTLTSNIDVGKIDVKASDSIGQILKSISTSFSDMAVSSATSCSGTSTLMGTFVKPFALSALGNRIYSTNIAGIGIRVNMEGRRTLNIPGSMNINPGGNIYGSGTVVVQIIKTANDVQPGILEPGRYAQWIYSGMSVPKHVLNITGSVRALPPTCAWIGNGDRLINLSPVSIGAFTGVGSSAAEQVFQLDLNCNAGLGGTVRLAFDFISRSDNIAVLQNTSLAAQKARGIDVQMISKYQGSNTVISKGSKLLLATLAAGQDRIIQVPFSARYYQSEQNISAGEVRAQATLTFEYH